MPEHSPLPWWKEVDPKGRLFGDGSPLCLVKCSRGIVAEIVGGEEADLIIHAVNSHCELLAAAKLAEEALRMAIPQEAVQVIHDLGDFNALALARIRLEEAITEAEGGES